MSKTRCPRFFCDGVGIPAVTNKKFSAKKAIVGNTLGGFFLDLLVLLLVHVQVLMVKMERLQWFAVSVVAHGKLNFKIKKTRFYSGLNF